VIWSRNEVGAEGEQIFLRQTSSGIDLWTGDPSCQAAHDALLSVLAVAGPFIGPGEPLSTRRQGNLGEFVALHVALSAPLQHTSIHALNAFQPLQDISHAGLDVTYLYFDPSDPGKDAVYIQEVKTTGGENLSYADSLTEDYKKLFEDNAKFTLNTRIQGLAFKLDVGDKRPDLAERLRLVATTEAKLCSKVKLIPTLVHEKVGTDPVTKLVAVKTAITGLGWGASQIEPWSVAFENLIQRLTRMARGQN
jgi:hypothetical protein